MPLDAALPKSRQIATPVQAIEEGVVKELS
jgi:hypothetical protein